MECEQPRESSVRCAGGLPIGVVLMKQHVADAMKPGDHGSTFAGNPLVCAAAVATFDIIADEAFLQEVERKGERLRAGLRKALDGNSHVQVRPARCRSAHAQPTSARCRSQPLLAAARYTFEQSCTSTTCIGRCPMSSVPSCRVNSVVVRCRRYEVLACLWACSWTSLQARWSRRRATRA